MKQARIAAVGLVLFIMLFSVAGFAIYALTQKDINNWVGDNQLSLIEAIESGQEALVYLDESSRIALSEAITETIEASGGTTCGALTHPFWYHNGHDSCIPDVRETLVMNMQSNLQYYLNHHPSMHYPIEHDITIENDKPLLISGAGKGTLRIPLTTKAIMKSYIPQYPGATFTEEIAWAKSRDGQAITNMLISTSEATTLREYLDNPKRESAHYLIYPGGPVHQVLREERAPECGKCNANTIRIVLLGTIKIAEKTTQQDQALKDLEAYLTGRYPNIIEETESEEQLVNQPIIIQENTPPPPSNLLSQQARDQVLSYQDIITEAAVRYQVSEELIKAIITQESRGDTLAISPSGCAGLMQFCIGTAKTYKEHFTKLTTCYKNGQIVCNPDNDDRFTAQKNIMAGAAHWKYLLGLFEGYQAQVFLAIGSYNGGQGVMLRAAQSSGPNSGKDSSWPQIRSHISADLLNSFKDYQGWTHEQRVRKVKEITDYVDKVSAYYEYWGGSAQQEDVTALGNYYLDSIFTSSSEYSLAEFDDIANFVKDIEERDIIDAPTREVEQIRANYPSISNTDQCESAQDYVYDSFIRHYQECLEQQETRCGITLPQNIPVDYLVVRVEMSGKTIKLAEPVSDRSTIFPLNVTQGEQESLLITYEHKELSSITKQVNNAFDWDYDATIPLEKNEKGELIILKDGKGIAPVTYYIDLCSNAKDNDYLGYEGQVRMVYRPILFSLRLEDRIPPPPDFSLVKLSPILYQLQIAAPRYEDGRQALDINEYELHCSAQPFPEEGPLDESTMTNLALGADTSITFTPCVPGGVNHLSLVAIDLAGQRSHTQMTLTTFLPLS